MSKTLSDIYNQALATTPEAELKALKTEIKAYIAEVFKTYGKTFDPEKLGSHHSWEGDLGISVTFERTGHYYRIQTTNQTTIQNSQLVLKTSTGWNLQTIGKDGGLSRFRTKHTEIALSKGLTQIKLDIDKFIARLPGFIAGLNAAAKIEADRREDRRIREAKVRDLVKRLSALTGYKASYDGVETYGSPYTRLDVDGSTDTVTVQVRVTLDKFPELHQHILELTKKPETVAAQ